MSVDPETGVVAVVFYDRRNTTGDGTDVTMAVSEDGGATFDNFTVSEATFYPEPSTFFGDYIGIDTLGGDIHATWMSLDLSGNLDVWSAKVSWPPAVGVGPLAETTQILHAPGVSSRRSTQLQFTTFEDGRISLALYDLRGRLVRTLVDESRPAGTYEETWNGRDRSGGEIASGMYVVRLQAGNDVVTKKVVVVD
jgi:hypothetical protein